jgi:hypothetical protein
MQVRRASERARDAWRRWAPPALRQPRALPLAALLAGFLLFSALGLRLTARVSLTGDEPWYAAQAYALWHYHTPALFTPRVPRAVYEPLLRGTRDDHTRDYLGNGERVLVNLPGYAAVIAPFFALGGRKLVVLLQALAAAGTGALLVGEAWCAFRSRAVAAFAWAAYALLLPVQVYVGQLFPSTLAACALFGGFVLARRIAAAERGRALPLAVALGALAALLPWLHSKYILPALALAALGMLAARPRWPARTPADRRALGALATIGGLLLLSLALIALYSHRYFGTWTPPNARAQPDLAHPHPGAVITLFGDMLFGQQSGLLPWAPVDALVVVGLVLLVRQRPRVGWPVLALLAALAAAFLPAAVTPVFQGKALPGRFTLEWAPFLALGVAAVFAWAWRGVRQGGAWARRAAALGAVALLLTSAWFAWVGQRDPALLYPGPSGNRLAAEYPHALPLWWFHAFPSLPAQWVARGRVAFGAPRHVPGGAWQARTRPLLAPPGRYRATFRLACAGGAATAAIVRVGVTAPRPGASGAIEAAARVACGGAGSSQSATLTFASDGYHSLAFTLAWPEAALLRTPLVTYEPG